MLLVSKSQLRYSRKVKEDLGVQLNKKLNKKLITEAVATTPMVGVDSEVVLNAMTVAPTLRLSFGDDENRFRDLLLAIERIGLLKMGILFQKLRGRRGNSKIWNFPTILILEEHIKKKN